MLQPSLSGAKEDKNTVKEELSQHGSVTSSDADGEVSTTPWVLGLLRSVLSINENLMSKGSEQEGIVENFKGYKRSVGTQDPWMSAVALDQVAHLQAMALTRDPRTDPDHSVSALVQTAITSGSLNALKWLVSTSVPMSKCLAETEGTECLYAAAKHPGDVYAEMTLLLLENKLSPGRLAGDGVGVTLLHRAACFTNTSLACRIMTMLLDRSDCDVNALDAFGNTAVIYALAAGCLHNACFLMKHLTCRLEAEYEGQASFYYTLHVVPSFASRAIMRELLLTKRDHAFLHCDAESKTCGCKGYERPREDEDGGSPHPCGFCGHEAICHRIVPLPSWFRDQYDTYVAAGNSPRRRSHSSSDDDSDTETSRHDRAEDDEDEEIVLENDRGRLDVRLLRRIMELRYDDILHANGLSVAVAFEHTEDATASDDPMVQETVTVCSDHLSSANCGLTEKELVLEEEADSVNEDLLAIAAIVEESLQTDADECVGTSTEPLRNAKSGRKFADYPRWLQQELAMVHAPRCLCQTPAFVISRRQLAHVAVCRWLRRTAIVHLQQQHTAPPGVMESAIIALASVQPAFEHWRHVADQLPARAVPRPPTPLPRILSSVLFHWQHGKEFSAFQRWKNHRTSAEVSHHRLATRLEHVAAEMRRNRFVTLQLRQQQLQDSTRGLQP
ncbi:uncharacterized protein KRP23_9208 [Phytophthora ramorum]|uniref:uncharacterized protein n=1 Tax=Phytophthora ramorum TaxID=164328 RepID=UPI0030AACFBA|nr:hypothetical protein KRP23_9208 [Phytophthora ramorum]